MCLEIYIKKKSGIKSTYFGSLAHIGKARVWTTHTVLLIKLLSHPLPPLPSRRRQAKMVRNNAIIHKSYYVTEV